LLHRLLAALGTGSFRRSAMFTMVNVEDYGAVHDGATDDSAAINAAIAALPVTGGIVYFPAGDYAIGSTINVGDGTIASISTRQGVKLWGIAGPQIAGMAGNVSNTNYGGVRLKWTGAAHGTMVSVNGPIVGWGIENFYLDGDSVADYCLIVSSAQAGEVANLATDGALLAGIFETTVPPFGGIGTETMHNNWRNIWILMPLVTGGSTVRGLLLDGEATDTFDTTFEVFENVTINMPAVTVGNSAYGILFQRCDSNTIRDLHVAINPGATGTVIPLVFNYTPYDAWPSDNILESVTLADPSLYTAPAANGGIPSGIATVNRILHFRTWHPASPGLANLSWGATASNP
jgi:polygalacturonase